MCKAYRGHSPALAVTGGCALGAEGQLRTGRDSRRQAGRGGGGQRTGGCLSLILGTEIIVDQIIELTLTRLATNLDYL